MATGDITGKEPSRAKQSRPRISAPQPKFATVIVGTAKKPFVVHEHLLTHYSDFFRAALTGGFKEAKDKTVKLEEEDEKTFEVFVHWLYYQRFPDPAKGDDDFLVHMWTFKGLCDPDFCITLHVFCNKYQVPNMARETLDAFVDSISDNSKSKMPSSEAVELAFNSLPESSVMRRALIDIFCWYAGGPSTVNEQNYNNTFLLGIWSRLDKDWRNSRTGQATWEFDRCDYHDHKNEEKKACKQEYTQKQKEKK